MIPNIDTDMAAYEFALPGNFNYRKFRRDVKGGSNGYWAVALPEKGITRFKGVLLPSYTRVFVDYPHRFKTLYIITPQKEKMTALEVAQWFFKKFPGGTMYKDGRQVMPE
jgi:hypothetical protein